MNDSRGTLPSLAYLAGIIDSRGSLLIRPSRGYLFPYLRLNGDVQMLNLLANEFGGNVVASRHCNAHWIRSGTEVQQILLKIRPFLILKAEAADRCLAWQPVIAARPRKGRRMGLIPETANA